MTNLILTALLVSSCMCGRNDIAADETPAVNETVTLSETSTTSEMKAKADEKIGGVAEFDKLIHNFGDVMLSDGPLSCSFTIKNISKKPIVIYNVVTSCGCTDVKWTREPIMPGKTGTISSTYTNDEGPYPFDKTLTAYISDISKPVILRMRGVSHDKKLSLEEMYPVKAGDFGFKTTEIKCGNIEQGESRSEEILIANLSSDDVKISFDNISDGLEINVSPNPVPARSTARLTVTVSSRPGLWGKNFYHAGILSGEKTTGTRLSVYAFTKENFGSLTAAERADASRPIFTTNTFSAGKIKAGTKVRAVFSATNAGKDEFRIYKMDIDNENARGEALPVIKTGEKGNIAINLDTSGMQPGELLVTATLTTNSPARPIVNLFITGWIE